MFMLALCEECGEPARFNAFYGDHRFCSPACRHADLSRLYAQLKEAQERRGGLHYS